MVRDDRSSQGGADRPEGGQWPSVQWPSLGEPPQPDASYQRAPYPSVQHAAPAAPQVLSHPQYYDETGTPVQPTHYDEQGRPVYDRPVYEATAFDPPLPQVYSPVASPATAEQPLYDWSRHEAEQATASQQPAVGHADQHAIPEQHGHAEPYGYADPYGHEQPSVDHTDFTDPGAAAAGPFDDEGVSRADQRRAKRGGRRKRTAVVLTLALLLVGGAGWAIVTVVWPALTGTGSVVAAGDYEGPGAGEVQIVINKGDSGGAIAKTLVEADVVLTTGAFIKAFEANAAAVGIQPGTYTLQKQMSSAQAVDALLDKDNRVVRTVTIIPGSMLSQILEKASATTSIPMADFEAAMKDPEALGLPKEAKGEFEGWLAAETYAFEPGVTAEKILKEAIATQVALLEKLDAPRKDWHDIIVKASLVEQEFNRDEDRAKGARVIESRLEKKWTLGIDASTAYGAGINGTKLTDKELKSKDPYNLRVVPGLPPTAIATPGKSSIEAVLDPADGDWMFWCAINLDTGETVFSVTLDEHNVAVKKLEAWMAENSEG